jgi:hypothetical protein
VRHSAGAKADSPKSQINNWFERLLAELGFELWIVDPAEISEHQLLHDKHTRQYREGVGLRQGMRCKNLVQALIYDRSRST